MLYRKVGHFFVSCFIEFFGKSVPLIFARIRDLRALLETWDTPLPLTANRFKQVSNLKENLRHCPSPLNLSQIDLSDLGGSGGIEDGSKAVFG